MKSLVDVVINYYNPLKLDILFTQTLFCINCYKLNEINKIVLIDGSGTIDERFEEFSKVSDFVYLVSDKKLTFSEGNKAGIEYLEKK